LTTFTGGASKNIGKALNELKEEDEDLKGVIIDLRDNGGGLLIEAVDICGLFLPSNTLVVSNKGKVKDRDQSFKTRRAPMDVDIPIAVLINKSSASASEIVSGTLQDYDRGVLLGQRSFGKGLVQNTQEVGYNNRVKLTTSKYYIPSGRCIQGVEYDQGVPVDIPDERRSKFKTKNGRTVLDGGGVTPDVKLPAKEEGELLKALKEQHIIFKFVNEFVAKKDSIAAAGSFQFEDYKSFTDFVKKIGFTYQTQAEKDMDQLKASTSKTFNKELKSLSQKIEKEKEAAFEKEKADIIKEIEQSIVGRYYFQAGKAHQALNNDSEVLEAIRILTTPSEYKAILK
jgi:carboxyl-terminal processing protease